MCVRARPAEGIDPGHGRRALRDQRPRSGAGWHGDGQGIPLHRRVGVLEVQVPRDDAGMQREGGLDDGSDAGCGFQMPEVGLDGTDIERIVLASSAPVDRRRRPKFDGIPDLGAGAVGFDILYVQRPRAGSRESGFDDLLLGLAARHCEPRCGAVLVYGTAPNQRPDSVPVVFRVHQTLQHHDAATFTAHIAVGRGVERLNHPVRRQHACPSPPFGQAT